MKYSLMTNSLLQGEQLPLMEQGIEDIIGDRRLEEYGKYECDQFDKNYTTKSSLLSSQAEQILNGLHMNVINVNTKQICKSDITKQKQANLKIVKLNMNATSVNTNLHESYKIKA